MRVAHFDCFSGISGDMVLGAVIDAGVPADAIRAALDSLGLPIKLEVEKVKRCGFAATKATVEAADQEDYRFLPDVEAILAKGALTAEAARTGDWRSSARSPWPRRPSTGCRWSGSTSTRSGRSTASPTSSARRSGSTCSASSGSPARRCRPAPAR